MLEMFMFAAEPFGTWGPGPVPEPVGYWAQILDPVVSDPQAVATIIAAFLGFLSGVLVKYWLDQRAERLRREADRRLLATALRAELLRFDVECAARIETFEEMLEEQPKMDVFGGSHSFDLMALPPRRVWMALLGRIGELKGVALESLILVHSGFDSNDLAVQTAKQSAGGQGVNREDLQYRIDQLRMIREAISKAGDPLIEQTKVGPSLWRRISRFKGLRLRARHREATESIPKEHRKTS